MAEPSQIHPSPADNVEQVEKPVDNGGILRIDTGKVTLSIPFKNLMRFPDCLLARCTDGVRSKEVVIQMERDANYVGVILDYIRDESKSALERILDRGWKFTSAIAEEAGYFLLDELAKECKEALGRCAMRQMQVGLITSTRVAFDIYQAALLQNTGLIFINPGFNQFDSKRDRVFNDLRLLDHDNVHVYTVSSYGYNEELLAFKLPLSKNLRRVTIYERLPEIFYQINMGIESRACGYSRLFTEILHPR